jgi:polysaccharide biosynthesis/export protein
VDFIHRNCRRTPYECQSQKRPRPPARWMQLGALWLILLNVVQCGSSKIAAANLSSESAVTNSEPRLTVRPDAQRNSIRFVANCEGSAPINSHADQSMVPTFDEKLLAVAVYANCMRANLSVPLTKTNQAPSPEQSQMLDIAQLLQAAQDSIRIPDPPATTPLNIKLSIAPPSPVAAESTTARSTVDLPVRANANSEYAIRSITKSSPVVPSAKSYVEPVFRLVNEAPIPTVMPAVVSSESTSAADATANATHQSPAAQYGESIVDSQPVIAVSQPNATDREPVVADNEPTIAASEPTIAASEPTIAASEPTVAVSEPTVAVSEPTVAASEPTVAASEPTVADNEPTMAASELTVAANQFSAASCQPMTAVSEPTTTVNDPIQPSAQPSVIAHQSALEWRAQDFAVLQHSSAASEVRIKRVGSPIADFYTMAQAQASTPHQPAPSDAVALPAPKNAESLSLEEMGIPPMPLTNSSYLPASPENYCYRCGVKCPPCGCQPGGPGWAATRPIPWEVFAQGEYIGPARLAHVPIYRLRVDDRLAFVYRLSGKVASQPYRLNVRDRIQVQSLSAPEVINRELIVQPDGTITLPLLGQVRAAGATLEELSKHLDEQFKSQIKDPRITVTPLVLNSNLEELRSSVDRRYGQGGQVSDARVSPDGTVQLPAIGPVPAQGMTLEEMEREVKTRYARIVEGLEVTPILLDRAPRFIYVVGEVKLPGRYTMEGPTTLMQAVALAGSWNVGAQLNNVVVFRRDENWQLIATKVDIRSSLLFKKPCPAGEIWLRDSDIVLIPKSPILCADDVIELVFTRGIYGVFPMTAQLNFSKLTTL